MTPGTGNGWPPAAALLWKLASGVNLFTVIRFTVSARRKTDPMPLDPGSTTHRRKGPNMETTSFHPQDDPHRRIREGELYYVEDVAAPAGWSIVEINGSDDGELAGFALGQLEAIPLSELEGRILGPLPVPGSAFARTA